MRKKRIKTFAFIDASNLFYGGEKSLGWKIDYAKLLKYLRSKYGVSLCFYFGGIELFGYHYDYLNNTTVPMEQLELYTINFIKTKSKGINSLKFHNLNTNLQKIRFYKKLDEFGYNLFIKPVKKYLKPGGDIEYKANCDVEMAFHLMKERDNFHRVVFLSGDGDFLPVLKYLKELGKTIIVLARGHRTAKEIRQFAGSNFTDFVRLETKLKFEAKKRSGHTKYPLHV